MASDSIIEQSNPKPVIARQKGKLGAVMIDPKTGKPIPSTWVPKAEVPEKALKYLDPAKFSAAEKRNKDRQAQIDAEKQRVKGVANPPATTPPSPSSTSPSSSSTPAPSSSSFKWNPNKNIIAAKGGKLGIMDKGDPKSWREPSEQEKGEIPISSTEKFRSSAAGQEFLKQKGSGTAKTSPASASTAEKIKGGLETYKKQVASGDIKGAKATGRSTWELANPELAKREAERERTRGTSATTNPLMKDFKSSLPAPKSTSSSTSGAQFSVSKDAAMNKVADNLSKNPLTKKITAKESYDAFDLVLEYLLSTGHADTIDEASYIMMEMGSEMIQSIVEGVMPEPIDPVAHKAAQKTQKIYNLGKGTNNPNEAKSALKRTGPQLPGV